MLTNFPNNQYPLYHSGIQNSKYEKIENSNEQNLLKSPEPENLMELSRKNSIVQNDFAMDEFHNYDNINNNFHEQYPFYQNLQRPMEVKEEMVIILFINEI